MRTLLVPLLLVACGGDPQTPDGSQFVSNAGTDLCPYARDPNVARADYDPSLGVGRCAYTCSSRLMGWCWSERRCVMLTSNTHCNTCDLRCDAPFNCLRYPNMPVDSLRSYGCQR